MIQIRNIKVPLNEEMKEVVEQAIQALFGRLYPYVIVKESIDARKDICFVYTINVDAPKVRNHTKKYQYEAVSPVNAEPIRKGNSFLEHRPIIIGFGPAGMFAALKLAQEGYRPIVFERGLSAIERKRDVEAFWESGILKPDSNVQFGEGGAGTFSDGKLTTRIKDRRVGEVLEMLVAFGAPNEIRYAAKPHVGTDILIDVVQQLRNEIIRLGGEVRFQSCLTDIRINQGKIEAVQINNEWFESEVVVLAIGHSARDTFRLLHKRGVQLIPKPFAVGFRIEHPQVVIDKAQYKEHFDHPKLKSAEYALTHRARNGRSCYTFCMCPGGRVIASASEYNQVVVNGMSYHARDLENANSAVLCSITPEDFSGDVLSGVVFQEEIEHRAFEMGGADYSAPIQLVGDFLNRRESNELGSVVPSYKPGVQFARLDQIYPEFVYEGIADAIRSFGKKLKGFDMSDSILTGVETRTSSPIRIVRGESLESANAAGLYPCGEGAGYAGGIVSAAVDGLKAAYRIIEKYSEYTLS